MIFIGKKKYYQNNVKQRTINGRILLGPNSVRVVVIVLIAAFSLFYLSQSSQSATRNYIVSDLEEQKKEGVAEKERLEVEANRLKALSIIQEKAAENGMEQVSE
jgi:cell division protein FtsL